MPQNPFQNPNHDFEEGTKVCHWVDLPLGGDVDPTPLRSLESQTTDPDLKRSLVFTRLLAERAKHIGGRVLMVGGFVRDLILISLGRDLEPKDIDLEVYGLNPEKIYRLVLTVLADPVNMKLLEIKDSIIPQTVGRAFGVIKVFDIDIAVARLDSRSDPGLGRKPHVTPSPDVSFSQAAFRRDLTINALALDPLTHKVYDAYNGFDDLQRGVLRHIYARNPADTLFADDPLRVLRVMGFAGRLQFSIASETRDLCLNIPLQNLAAERIGEEWSKALLKSEKPSYCLEAARALKISSNLLPELKQVSSNEIDWQKNLDVLDRLAVSIQDPPIRLILLHTQLFNVRPDLIPTFLKRFILPDQSRQDFQKSIQLAIQVCTQVESLLENVKSPSEDRDFVLRHSAYVLRHAVYRNIDSETPKYLTLEDLSSLWFSSKAEPARHDSVHMLLGRARDLGVLDKAPECILTGSDVIALGVPAGPKVGDMLQKVMTAQLHGKFDVSTHQIDKTLAIEFAESIVE